MLPALYGIEIVKLNLRGHSNNSVRQICSLNIKYLQISLTLIDIGILFTTDIRNGNFMTQCYEDKTKLFPLKITFHYSCQNDDAKAKLEVEMSFYFASSHFFTNPPSDSLDNVEFNLHYKCSSPIHEITRTTKLSLRFISSEKTMRTCRDTYMLFMYLWKRGKFHKFYVIFPRLPVISHRKRLNLGICKKQRIYGSI